MAKLHRRMRTSRLVIGTSLVLLATACGSSGSNGSDDGSSGGEPITVGIVTSTSGTFANYGAAYVDGLNAGMDYATDGEGTVNGREVQLEIIDDAGEPANAVSAATDLVGRGVKIIAGSIPSSVALQLAPFAAENDVVFIAGPAATDALTGINENTFRAGRQTYQDVATAKSLLGEGAGDVLVYGQDYEFGKNNVAAVKSVLGGPGVNIEELLVPLTVNDFTPFSRQIVEADPDLLYVAWAGDTTPAMFQSLLQQNVPGATTVATGLGDRSTFASFGEQPEEFQFLAHYFAGATETAENEYIRENVDAPDLFTPDGFVTAQMIVRALQEGDPDDTASMIAALEGWEFDAPKGRQTIRASDHAMIQPMFTARLTGPVSAREAELIETLDAASVAPPEGS